MWLFKCTPPYTQCTPLSGLHPGKHFYCVYAPSGDVNPDGSFPNPNPNPNPTLILTPIPSMSLLNYRHCLMMTWIAVGRSVSWYVPFARLWLFRRVLKEPLLYERKKESEVGLNSLHWWIESFIGHFKWMAIYNGWWIVYNGWHE